MMNYFLYRIGNNVHQCRKLEDIPGYADGILKVENREFFSKISGKWEKIATIREPKKDNNGGFPESPIDVASMIINTTVTFEPPKDDLVLSPLLEPKPCEIPKYDILQLEEIAKHLLLYCETQRKGCGDGSNP